MDEDEKFTSQEVIGTISPALAVLCHDILKMAIVNLADGQFDRVLKSNKKEGVDLGLDDGQRRLATMMSFLTAAFKLHPLVEPMRGFTQWYNENFRVEGEKPPFPETIVAPSSRFRDN